MNGPSLQDFANSHKGKQQQNLTDAPPLSPSLPSLITDPLPGAGRKVNFEKNTFCIILLRHVDHENAGVAQEPC